MKKKNGPIPQSDKSSNSEDKIVSKNHTSEYDKNQFNIENEYRTAVATASVGGTPRKYAYSYNSYGLADHFPEWGPFHDPDMQHLKKILSEQNGYVTKVDMNAICYNGKIAGEKVVMEDWEKKPYIDNIQSIMRKEGVSYKNAKFNVVGEVMPYVMEGDGGCTIEVVITYNVPT